ncbi:MAG: hypothetical protein AB7E75_02875 [Candidatus Methanomethylophilaceae archaeon]|nr:hypothetical protein [Methanomethylophilus sp.]
MQTDLVLLGIDADLIFQCSLPGHLDLADSSRLTARNIPDTTVIFQPASVSTNLFNTLINPP